ncbi:hypothetical protein JCM33374_g6543 [Metschnikowia sp. JCM 33374]|nr:hypothetical protein JCM33374_g6543 [Metschnikowia sp. JCM 33374]
MSQPPPNPNQRNVMPTIQPAQATRLLAALREELAKAKAAGQDTTTARQHFAKAEQIKQVLVNYRQQQQQRQAAAARANAQGNFSGNTSASTTGNSGPAITPQQTPGSGTAPVHANQAQFHSSNVASRPGSTGFASGGNGLGSSVSSPATGVSQTPGVVGHATGNLQQQQPQQPQQQQKQQQQQQPQQIQQPPQAQTQPLQRSGIYSSTTMPNTAPDVTGQQRPPAVTSGVTPETYNQVRTRLQDLERKIRALEASKRPDMTSEHKTQFDNQLRELKMKYSQYSKFALYMQNQLLESARNAGQSAPIGVGTSPAPNPATPGLPAAAHTAPSSGTPAQSIHTPAVTNASQVANTANAAQENNQMSGSTANIATVGAGTPNKPGSRGPSPPMKEPTIPGVNLSSITKPSVPSIPISSTINVKPHNPITLKPGTNNVRPTLTAGASSGLGQVINSPAMMRMPTFDMASTGPIQDNGGRVLTKRKLTELVNTIGADEGDGKTTIDGDVEELLLDLADEFVSSVTTFACRLAKHRKTDAIDVRDVQLHLERNWNIRIPGHAMDEIRSMRKWQPSSSYTQKVSGVDIVKAVNGNIN